MRENIAASTQNVWAMEAEPGRAFAYELRRPGRFFRVEFDLTRAGCSAAPALGIALIRLLRAPRGPI